MGGFLPDFPPGTLNASQVPSLSDPPGNYQSSGPIPALVQPFDPSLDSPFLPLSEENPQPDFPYTMVIFLRTMRLRI
jgi:hypothetical protein